MNWMLNNPISEMPGPLFLGLYAAVIALVIVESRWRSTRADRSKDLGPEPVPTKPDPVEIAYLRGGENEVTRLVVSDLIRRGHLQVQRKKARWGSAVETSIERAADAPAADKLSTIEAEALDYFAKGRKPPELFQPRGLANRLRPWCGPTADRLREALLLTPPERYGAAWRNWLGGALMILAFGGFKFAVALAKGKHNVAFLLIFALVGLIALAIACRVPRLTRRGKDYLARLREAFGGLRARLAEPAVAGDDPALVLVPAVYGVGVLTGTPYAPAPGLFNPATSSASCGGAAASGGCGGGGGGCGGGGCGGGCGGCGGCGG